MYCSVCGKEVSKEAAVCMHCGCMINRPPVQNTPQHNSEEENGSHVSLILGIIGIVFAWLFALIGHVLSIIGIVLGIKEYKKHKKISGLVLSIIGEACSICSSMIGILIVYGLI